MSETAIGTTAASTTPAKARSAGPDQLKAILLAIVIFGHTYTAGVSEDFGKYLIYGFHMPAFLFLSGHLISTDRITNRPFGNFLSHYAKRMLIAWFAVSLAWIAQYRYDDLTSPATVAREIFLLPNFHLWYIPALFIALLLTWVLCRTRPGSIALAVIAVVGFFYFAFPFPGRAAIVQEVDFRYFGYLIFFVFGLAIRNKWVPLAPVWLRLVLVLGGGALYVISFTESGWYKPVGFLVLNLGLGMFVPAVLRLLERPLPVVGRPLALIGEYSLWLYLLHPFVTKTLQKHAPESWSGGIVYGLAVTVGILVAFAIAAFVWRAASRRQASRL